MQGTPQPPHERPRLLGEVATARSERIAVFQGSVDRDNHETSRPSIVPGHNVIVAVAGRGHGPVLVELEPTSALRLAAAVLAATKPENGG